MGGKKRDDAREGSKKAAGQARKADAAAAKASAEDAKRAAAEDSEWQKGAKNSAKKYVVVCYCLTIVSLALTFWLIPTYIPNFRCTKLIRNTEKQKLPRKPSKHERRLKKKPFSPKTNRIPQAEPYRRNQKLPERSLSPSPSPSPVVVSMPHCQSLNLTVKSYRNCSVAVWMRA
jgi:hypothetical protein